MSDHRSMQLNGHSNRLSAFEELGTGQWERHKISQSTNFRASEKTSSHSD